MTLRRAPTLAIAMLSATALWLSGCSAGSSDTPQTGAGQRPTARPSAGRTPWWNAHPSSIAALGDSITRGFDACSVLADCPQASWATGTRRDVNGLAERLDARSWNLAASGARMSELPAQAEQAAARHPQLVTVLMGANDACRSTAGDMTPVAEYRTEFTSAMDALHRASPGTEVYVASIPDLQRLWSTGRNSQQAAQVWNLGICPSLLTRAASLTAQDTARRAAVRDRVIAYNQVLQQVCAGYARCRYDEGAVFDYPVQAADVSPDWFHPSVQGQAELARLAYAGVTRR